MSEHGAARFADDTHRYRLDSRIATGGMGEVWRGTDTTLGRPVAVKLLKDEYAGDASFRSRFETEARHAASLQHHNIAAVFDVGEAGGDNAARRPFLVMELVDGQPLSALLRPGEPMDPDAVRGLLAQAADGLAAAHAAGIVHRDVKPANLLVTPDRQVKVTDFGIARAADGAALTRTGEVMGTPQYLSPEQAQGQPATFASDVYSLGVVAFECLAGRRPYAADSPVATALAHIREPVPPLPDPVPTDLAAVVRRAMAKLPQDRFADGAALAAALRDPATAATAVVAPEIPHQETRLIPGVLPPPATAVAGPVPTTGTPRRTGGRLLPILVVLALLVVGIIVAWALLSGDDQADQPVRRPGRHARTPSQTTQPSTAAPSTQPPSTPATKPPRTTSQAPTTSTPTRTPTQTPTQTPTRTPTQTPTNTPTGSPSAAGLPSGPASSAASPSAGPSSAGSAAAGSAASAPAAPDSGTPAAEGKVTSS